MKHPVAFLWHYFYNIYIGIKTAVSTQQSVLPWSSLVIGKCASIGNNAIYASRQWCRADKFTRSCGVVRAPRHWQSPFYFERPAELEPQRASISPFTERELTRDDLLKHCLTSTVRYAIELRNTRRQLDVEHTKVNEHGGWPLTSTVVSVYLLSSDCREWSHQWSFPIQQSISEQLSRT